MMKKLCGEIQGVLTEGEVSVQLTSLYQLVKINSLYDWNFLFLSPKQAILNKEANCTEPSPSIRIPW